jgi:hypothetical protein
MAFINYWKDSTHKKSALHKKDKERNHIMNDLSDNEQQRGDGTTDPVPVRQSTIVRQRRLHALIGQLAARDLDIPAVASFLDCSHSAARTYLHDLLDAGVVFRQSPSERCKYHLTRDAAQVQSFLAGLALPRRPTLTRANKPANGTRSFGARHFHIIDDDCYLGVDASQVPIRRDPLVAALFGKESRCNESAHGRASGQQRRPG